MTMNIPFIDYYLKDNYDNDEIKTIINNYKYKALNSSELEEIYFNIKKLDIYNHVIFFEEDDYYDELKNNKVNFHKINNNKICLIIREKKHNIKLVVPNNINLIYFVNMFKNIKLTNRTMIIVIQIFTNYAKKNCSSNNIKNHIRYKKIINYLPSSVNILDIYTNDTYIINKKDNLPNKIIIYKFIDYNSSMFNSKIPKNAIVIKINKDTYVIKNYKAHFNIKNNYKNTTVTRHPIQKLSRLYYGDEVNNYSCFYDIIQSKGKLELHALVYKKNKFKDVHENIEHEENMNDIYGSIINVYENNIYDNHKIITRTHNYEEEKLLLYNSIKLYSTNVENYEELFQYMKEINISCYCYFHLINKNH